MNTIYIPVSEAAQAYHLSRSMIYKLLNEIEECDRYRSARAVLDLGNRKRVNVLVLEDYMFFRQRLKHRNVARTLPPYDPVETARQRGEKYESKNQ